MRRRSMGFLTVALVLSGVALGASGEEAGGPPAATLTSASGTQRGEPGSSCWPNGQGLTLCRDVFVGDTPTTYVRVARREHIRFRILSEEQPNSVDLTVERILSRPGEPIEVRRLAVVHLRASTSVGWTVTVPAGRYRLGLSAGWGRVGAGKGASWSFSVRAVGSRALATTGAGTEMLAWLALIGLSLVVGGAFVTSMGSVPQRVWGGCMGRPLQPAADVDGSTRAPRPSKQGDATRRRAHRGLGAGRRE